MKSPRRIGTSRRTFLKHIAYAGAAAPLVMPRLVRASSPNGRLNMAGIGVGGKGWSDLNNTTEGQQVVAVCDIDANHLGRARNEFPDAAAYDDFRDAFDRHEIDACNVSTPDHMHAFITMWAMNRGAAVYTQKPLTHSIFEARALARVAAEKNIVTQMGSQGHSSTRSRLARDYMRRNVIGRIREIHAWTDRPHGWWPQPVERPSHAHPVPDHVSWDLWLGVAAERPFVRQIYHPFVWRGWTDFGTGAVGDIMVHQMAPYVDALRLMPPRTVRHEGPAATDESFPEHSIAHYEFDGTEHTADTLRVTWYDGGKMPPEELTEQFGQRLSDSGSFCIGEEGMMLLSGGGAPQLLPREQFREVQRPDLEPWNHYTQFRDAARGEDETCLPFSIATPLTEACLLGAIATRFPGETLQWDRDNMRFGSHDAANALVRRDYRDGWNVEGL